MSEPRLREDARLAEMVRRLVAVYQPQVIYLFGSWGRGEAEPDSDYDPLVVVSASDLAPHRRNLLAFRALWGVGAAKDVVVCTREELESHSHAASSLPATVLREGMSTNTMRATTASKMRGRSLQRERSACR